MHGQTDKKLIVCHVSHSKQNSARSHHTWR